MIKFGSGVGQETKFAYAVHAHSKRGEHTKERVDNHRKSLPLASLLSLIRRCFAPCLDRTKRSTRGKIGSNSIVKQT